jgi:hypothetical protein
MTARATGQWVSISKLQFAIGPVPHDDHVDGSICIVPGNWDVEPARIHASASQKTPGRNRPYEPLSLYVGRDGSLLIAAGDERALALIRSGATELYCRIAGRHPGWQGFRESLIQLIDDDDLDGEAYAPFTHPDLRSIKSWTGMERANAVVDAIDRKYRSIVDLGAHLGYMCARLEQRGHQCVAIEMEDKYLPFLLKLRDAERYNFEVHHMDALEYVRRGEPADVTLALALFHHFIKTRSGHKRLVSLLNALRTSEMIFWAHNPDERQMLDSYANYTPTEFADFIIQHSCLSHAENIGEFHARRLFRLWS